MANPTLSVPKTAAAAAVEAAMPAAAATPSAAPESQNNPNIVALAPTPQLNPRAAAMAEISARSNADADQNAAETVPVTDDDGNVVGAQTAQTEPTEAVEAETDAADTQGAAPVQSPVQAAPSEPAPTFNPEAEYDLVVDGKTIKVKGAQIIERGKMHIQKETAADFKLDLASRLLREAEARAAQPAPQPAAPAQPQYTPEQLAEMIQFGTKEQAAAAISLVMAQKQQTGPNVQELQAALPNVVRDQLSFQEGVALVKSEYADLMADPYLKPLFFMKETEKRQAGDKRSYAEIYKEIGEEIRTHFNKPKTTSAAPAAAPQTREQKVAAKQAAPAAPRLASARLEGAAPVKAPTREDVISRMQRARGQAAPTQH